MGEKTKKIIGRTADYLKTHPLLVSVILNLIFFATVAVLFGQADETGDDGTISEFIYGVYGSPDAHTIFLNYYLGWFLKSLAQIATRVPWYLFVMDAGMVASFTGISYVFLKKNPRWGVFFSLIILGTFGYECYSSLQFTKVAACLTVAGALLLVEEHWVLSFVFLIFGFMYRFDMCLAVLPLIGGYGIFKLVQALKSRNYKYVGKLLWWGIGTLVVCVLLKNADAAVYQSEPEWEEYLTFNTYRSALLDYGFPDYNENQEAYQSLGIEESDVQLFRSWDFADPDTFNAEIAAQLVALKTGKSSSGEGVTSSFWEQVPLQTLDYRWIRGFLIVFAVALFASRRNWWWLGYCLLVLMGLECYLYRQGRYLMNRVDTGLFLAATVMVVCVELDNARREERLAVPKMAASMILLLLLSQIPFLHSALLNTGAADEQEKTELKNLTNLMSEDSDNLYLASVLGGSEIWARAYGIRDRIPIGAKSNFYVLGGWQTYTPYTEAVLKENNIRNPYEECVDADVYVIDTLHIEETLLHIQKHYNENADAVLVKSLYGYPFYKIVAQPPDYSGMTRGDDEQLNFSFLAGKDTSGNVMVVGSAYVDGMNSYQSEAYINVTDSAGNENTFYLMQEENPNCEGVEHGQYSMFYTKFEWPEDSDCSITLWFKCEDKVFCREITDWT